jgi:hypothetical protein
MVFAPYLIFDIFEWIQVQRRARVHTLRLEKGAAKAARSYINVKTHHFVLLQGFGVQMGSVYLFLQVL